MIRDLRLLDLPRLLMPGSLGGEDLAYTRGEMDGGGHRVTPLEMARWSIASSKTQQPLAALRDARLAALAVLRARCGPRSWEVAHLFANDRMKEEVPELLERCVEHVGLCGGERLFIRVDYRSPLQEVARLAGFFPAFTEEVFSLRRSLRADDGAPSLDIRPPLPADTHGLFRLYNLALPTTVRAVSGLTLDQWQDSREALPSAGREYVWVHEDQVRGWLRLDHKGDALMIEALLHPDEGVMAPSIVEYAAHLARGHEKPSWIVPSYQQALSAALQYRGWTLQRTYSVLIRSVARSVPERAFMPAQA